MSRPAIVRTLRWLLLALPIVLTFAGGIAALAYWTTTGTGTASAGTTALAVPTSVSATATSTRGTVTVSWTGAIGPNGQAATRYYIQRLAGSTPSNACGSSPTSPLTTPPATCSDTGVPDGTYTYTVTTVFNSWTATSAASAAVTVVPAAPTSVTLVNGGGQGSAYIDSANVSNVSIDVGLGSTSLATDTVTLTVNDAGSVHVLAPTASATAGAGTVHFTGLNLSAFADGPISMSATSTDTLANVSGAVSGTVTKDTVAPAAPASVAISNGLGTGSAYINSTNASSVNYNVVLPNNSNDSATDTIAVTLTSGASVSGSFASGLGSSGGIVGVNAINASSLTDGSVAVSATATDLAGNVSGAVTTTTTKDTVAPTAPAPTLSAATGNTYIIGTTVYINPQAGKSGGFTVTDLPTDGTVGIQQVTFPALSGFTSGGGNVSASPYTTTYSWSGSGATASGSQTITVTNNAGMTSTTTFTVTPDTTAPTAPAPTLSAATGNTYIIGTTVYINPQAGKSGGFTVTDAPTDGTVGIQKVTFPALSGFTSGGGNVNASPYTTTYSWSGAGATASGSQTITVTNNLGTTSTTTFTVTPDTTAPTAPAPTLSAATGNTFISGTTVYINPQAGKSGGFTVTDLPTDGTVGIQKVTFPALSGFTSGGGNVSASPYTTTYSWSGAGATASGSQTITVTNNLGTTSTTTFTVTPDTTAPTAPTPTLSAATGNTYIVGTTVYINPQAGKSGGFTVTDAPTDGTVGIQKVTFPALSGFTSGGGNVSASPYTTTYAWSGAGATASGSQTITVTNNLGTTSTTTFTVTPDTTAPTAPAPTLSAATGNTFISGTTVYINPQAGKSGGFTVTDLPTDGTVGIQQVTFPALSGFTSGGGNVSASPYTTTYSWSGAGATASGSQTITVTNNLGTTSTTTFTVTPDTTAPTAPTPTLSAATGNTYIVGTTVYINPQAGKSGGFTVTDAPTDGTVGIQKVTFPALSGFTSGGGNVSASPYTTTYAWSGAGATASGSQTITVTNNLGTTSTTTFTVTPDTTAPTVTALCGGSTCQPTNGGLIGSITVNITATDAGSGLASLVCKVGSTTETCASFSVGGVLSTSTVSYTATDNVGNVTTGSFTVTFVL